MGEVFKEVKEKFERYKFNVDYIDREYPVSSANSQVPIPIGERNAFTGIIVNNGSAILTITLVKVAHASTASTQTSDVGTVTLNPGQVLELRNFPVNEIQVTYNPNSLAGTSSIVQVKGVIHPLFESPVSLNVADITSLQKSNSDLLITANVNITNGVYDTIVISQNLTVNFNGFVVAKKLIIENNANVNVNGVLVVDEVQCDGNITVANFMSVKRMFNNGSEFYINEGAYVIADEIIFSPNMTLIDYNGNGNGNLFANFIYFQTYSANYILSIYANTAGKLIIEGLMEITAGSLTQLVITDIINSDISITGSNLLVKFVKNATISSLNAQVSSSYFEFDNAYMPSSYFTNNGPGNNIYIVVKGNSIVQLYIDSLYSYVFFRKNENGEGNIQVTSGSSFGAQTIWYIDFGVTVTASASFSSSNSQITCNGQLFLQANLTTTSASSTTSPSVSLGLPFSIQGVGVAIIAPSGVTNLQGNPLSMSNLTLAPGKYSTSTGTGSGNNTFWYITQVQATAPGLYYLGLYDETSGATNYIAEIVIYIGTVNQYTLNNPYGFVAEGAISATNGNTYAVLNSASSAGTITLTGTVYM